MNKYIREGGRSFNENSGRYVNPYEQGSAEFNDFERGWTQALKRSPEELRMNYGYKAKTLRQKCPALPELTPTSKQREMPEDIYVLLATRAREKLLNAPLYEPPKHAWPTKVYYVRIETNQMPLWKIGVTSNNFIARYCIADRKAIVKIKSWHYASREEAEAIEREILAEFEDDAYEGCPVLLSGGDSELFTRDVLKLDSLEDFRAMARREAQAREI